MLRLGAAWVVGSLIIGCLAVAAMVLFFVYVGETLDEMPEPEYDPYTVQTYTVPTYTVPQVSLPGQAGGGGGRSEPGTMGGS
jgi:hypothetical protein